MQMSKVRNKYLIPSLVNPPLWFNKYYKIITKAYIIWNEYFYITLSVFFSLCLVRPSHLSVQNSLCHLCSFCVLLSFSYLCFSYLYSFSVWFRSVLCTAMPSFLLWDLFSLGHKIFTLSVQIPNQIILFYAQPYRNSIFIFFCLFHCCCCCFLFCCFCLFVFN